MLDGEFQESDIIMARDTALILTFLPQIQSIYISWFEGGHFEFLVITIASPPLIPTTYRKLVNTTLNKICRSLEGLS